MAEILNEAQVPQQHQTHNATIIDLVNFVDTTKYSKMYSMVILITILKC